MFSALTGEDKTNLFKMHFVIISSVIKIELSILNVTWFALHSMTK